MIAAAPPFGETKSIIPNGLVAGMITKTLFLT
jgi:hypothetical protein